MTHSSWVKFDGYPIELYDGRFSGTFELDEEVGEAIKYEQVVSFLVVANASKAAISTNKDGDLKRTNTFAVQQVKLVSNEQAEALLWSQVALPLAAPEEEPSEEKAEGPALEIDGDTGELVDVYIHQIDEPVVLQDPISSKGILKDFLYGDDR